ncbi:MAG: hypothetical protein F6K62_18915 [Sphaerospermopsis sp. SIO1G2]|nr:hypothetical protein [Sphaerospermopsis sp. SIO1G2]
MNALPLFEIFITPVNSCPEEIENLIEREEVASLARRRFLEGLISFDDFMDCLKLAGMNIDDQKIIYVHSR